MEPSAKYKKGQLAFCQLGRCLLDYLISLNRLHVAYFSTTDLGSELFEGVHYLHVTGTLRSVHITFSIRRVCFFVWTAQVHAFCLQVALHTPYP